MASIANGRLDKEASQDVQAKISTRDTKCGFGCYPDAIQRCANLPCFTFSYGLCGFVTQSLSVYISSQITSIEKQFGLSGKQTGFLLSCSDIGFLVTVLFTSHFFAKGNIPRYLGLVTIMFGISGITCSLPHLILGVNDADRTGSNPSGGNDDELCQRGVNASAVQSENCTDIGGSSFTYTAIGILAIGMMLQGVAKGPRTALVATYVDNNVVDKARTGIFIGIVTAIGVLGPAVAIGIGGVFSSIYVTLEDVNIETTDPKWIGAWWLGFIVFGVLSLVVAIPVSLFPKQMPVKRNSRETKVEDERDDVSVVDTIIDSSRGHANDGTKRSDKGGAKAIAHEFLKVLKKLVTNCTFVLIVLSTAVKIFSFSGLVYYAPKYVEKQFLVPAWKANYIVGGLSMVDVFGGTVFGGYLTSRLKLTRLGNMKLILLASAISLLGLGLAMLFGCDQPVINDFNRIRNPSGVRTVLERRSIDSACAADCTCDVTKFYPVCGENGNNFYSACHAGCNSSTDRGFVNCLCVGINGTVASGFCDKGCTDLIPYCFMLVIIAFSVTIQLVPIYMVIIRSVEEEEKATAVGINSMMNTLLGWLPGPILFGMIFDTSCLIWTESCNRTGSCALYDLVNLRVSYYSLSLGANVLSFILLVAAFIKTRHTDCKSLDLKQQSVELEIKN